MSQKSGPLTGDVGVFAGRRLCVPKFKFSNVMYIDICNQHPLSCNLQRLWWFAVRWMPRDEHSVRRLRPVHSVIVFACSTWYSLLHTTAVYLKSWYEQSWVNIDGQNMRRFTSHSRVILVYITANDYHQYVLPTYLFGCELILFFF